MYCKYCGKTIDNDSLFCASCGKPLTAQNENSSKEKTINDFNFENEEEIIIEVPDKNIKRPPKSVSFLTAIKNLYINFTNFSGRAVRTEYWYVWLFNFIISTVITVLSLPPAISYAWTIIHLIPGTALSVRRLHDTGRSANYLWLLLIPFIGPFILIYFDCCDSDMDNQWGLSPYNSNKATTTTKKYHGYSATTKNATHKWYCDCGAYISVSLCPFCGKEHIITINNEDDLKKFIFNRLKDESLPTQEIEFFNKYLNCIYEDTDSNTIENFKYIFLNSHKYLNENNLKIMYNLCETKLTSLNLKRCMGCGEILPIDIPNCNCGYKF